MNGVPRPSTPDALLRPNAVAVVGASERSSMAARLTTYLRGSGFHGEVYPVNPNYQRVHGIPCFPSLRELPGRAELVLVLVPASRVLTVIDEAAEAGASVVVVLSSGFAETGDEGRVIQAELVERARQHGIRVIGPNCQGVIYDPSGLKATFTAAADLPAGTDCGIGYIGQSGALGGSFLGMASDRGIGLTAWVSVGNQADLTVTETAALLIEDPKIRVLACYFEELPEGGAWAAVIARAAELGKRLVVLRSGRSADGQRAIASHTGALVRSGTAFDLTTTRSGGILVDDLDELLDTAVAMTGSPRARTGRIAVVTSSGGAGSLTADQAEPRGLALPVLAEPTRAQLRPLIPAFGSVTNPVDVTAQVINDVRQFGSVCRTVAADGEVDAVLVVLTTLGGDTAIEIAESILDAASATTKPYVVAWLYSHAEIAPAATMLRRAGISVLPTTTAALNVLSRLVAADPPLPSEQRVRGLDRFLSGSNLTEAEGAALLDAVGVVRPSGTTSADPAVIGKIARELGDRVVLKIQSPDLTHKSDVGGVLVGVASDQAGREAARMLDSVARTAPQARIDGVLVQELLPPGLELLVGVQGSRDGYPPVLTVGMGGVTAEVDDDVTSALAPVTTDQAITLLQRLRGWPLLDGFRGRPRLDVVAAGEAISALSHAAVELGERLTELEINPLVVHQTGCTAADLVVSGPRPQPTG